LKTLPTLGTYFQERLAEIPSPYVKEVRGKGIAHWHGVKAGSTAARAASARRCKSAAFWCKETHENVIRFAPPLVITREEIDWALPSITDVLNMN
jgi:ornithine--oxo-acid transaminase